MCALPSSVGRRGTSTAVITSCNNLYVQKAQYVSRCELTKMSVLQSLRQTMVRSLRIPQQLLQECFERAVRKSRFMHAIHMLRSTVESSSLSSAVHTEFSEGLGPQRPHSWERQRCFPSCMVAGCSHCTLLKVRVHSAVCQGTFACCCCC